jgi:hypothetical protein
LRIIEIWSTKLKIIDDRLISVSDEDIPNDGHFVVPEGIKYISADAFFGCTRATSITIASGVRSIGHFAFAFCSSATSITIPPEVSSIGFGAFTGCDKLNAIVIDTEDEVEFARIKRLLPNDLKDKVISIPDYKKIKAIQQNSLLPFSYDATVNPLYHPSTPTSASPHFFGNAHDVLKHLNRFIENTSPSYKEAKGKIMACPIPVENHRVNFEAYYKALL